MRVIKISQDLESVRDVISPVERAAVKPEDVWPIIVDNLFDLILPFLDKLFTWFSFRVSVKIGVLRIEDVPAFLFALFEQLIIFCVNPSIGAVMMEACEYFHFGGLFSDGSDEFAILLRSPVTATYEPLVHDAQVSRILQQANGLSHLGPVHVDSDESHARGGTLIDAVLKTG